MDSHVIAKNAMDLWQMMNDGTVWCYKKLKELSRLSDREIDFALGWLIREDSLEIKADPLTMEDTYQVRHFWETAGY